LALIVGTTKAAIRNMLKRANVASERQEMVAIPVTSPVLLDRPLGGMPIKYKSHDPQTGVSSWHSCYAATARQWVKREMARDAEVTVYIQPANKQYIGVDEQSEKAACPRQTKQAEPNTIKQETPEKQKVASPRQKSHNPQRPDQIYAQAVARTLLITAKELRPRDLANLTGPALLKLLRETTSSCSRREADAISNKHQAREKMLARYSTYFGPLMGQNIPISKLYAAWTHAQDHCHEGELFLSLLPTDVQEGLTSYHHDEVTPETVSIPFDKFEKERLRPAP
jgi:hypothetical protein